MLTSKPESVLVLINLVLTVLGSRLDLHNISSLGNLFQSIKSEICFKKERKKKTKRWFVSINKDVIWDALVWKCEAKVWVWGKSTDSILLLLKSIKAKCAKLKQLWQNIRDWTDQRFYVIICVLWLLCAVRLHYLLNFYFPLHWTCWMVPPKPRYSKIQSWSTLNHTTLWCAIVWIAQLQATAKSWFKQNVYILNMKIRRQEKKV